MDELRRAKEQGLRLVWLDEINFTKRSVNLQEYSGRNTNLTIDQRDIFVGYRSVIASMSYDSGVGLVEIHGEAIDAEDFLVYLKKLRARNGKQAIALFMD